MHNVITEIPWISTTHGKKTIHDALHNAHTTNLDTNQAGYFYGAQLRILTHVAAPRRKSSLTASLKKP